jgi:hypothetical protein
MHWIRKALVVTAGLAVSAAAAGAQQVQYCTQYSFTNTFASLACGLGDSRTFTNVGGSVGTATLTFTGQALTTVNAPTFADYGTVEVVNSSGAAQNIGGTQIFLRILQFAPTNGQATVVGSMSGAISGMSSTGVINWNSPSRFATIGPVTYEVERLSQGQTSINAGNTGPQTIRGFVTTVPEPSTYALMGTGLLGLLGVAARRRRESAV